MRFALVEIVSDSPALDLELEFVRNLRNSVRKNMTGNTKFIHNSQQHQWFESLDHEQLRLFLFLINDEPAGYGIIRWKDGASWLTGALLEKFRGKGHGRRLFNELIVESKKFTNVIRLNAWTSNRTAVNLYKSLGFEEVSISDDIVEMEYIVNK